MMRRYALAVVALLGIIAAAAMVVEGNSSPPATTSIFQPAEAPFSSYIFGPGIIQASTENISVGTPVSGIVTDIYVKWGQQVTKGTPLFKIDTRDLESQLLPATANFTQAKEMLAKAENHLRVGETLSPGVSISSEDLANRRFDVRIAKAGIASAEAQVQQLQDEMQLRTIRAPVSGAILQLNIHLGEYAPNGNSATPLMVLGNDTVLYVRVDIDQSDAWRFMSAAPAVAYVRGNASLKTQLSYVRTDPFVVPQTLLTGDATQRTDTRVLEVVFRFNRAALPAYVGQLMDVFIQAPPLR